MRGALELLCFLEQALLPLCLEQPGVYPICVNEQYREHQSFFIVFFQTRTLFRRGLLFG